VNEPAQPAPRRIARATRYGLAAVLSLLFVPILGYVVPQAAAGGTSVTLIVMALSVPLVFIVLMVMNTGFRPRVQGQYLEVTTVLGRQSLDLTTVEGAKWERGRSGFVMLRVRDDVTDVVINLPFPPAVRDAVRQALLEAGQRGHLLPLRVTRLFNLPPMPGAPRTGFSIVPFVFAALVGVLCVGFAVAFILST
jgi:hypothetical protein